MRDSSGGSAEPHALKARGRKLMDELQKDLQTCPPWAKGVVPLTEVAGEDAEETVFLLEMAEHAKRFLQSFTWCRSVVEVYFGEGIGKIIGLFLCKIVPAAPEVDEWLWVIVGDIPPAYLVTDRCKNPTEALDAYIEEMAKWVEVARQGLTSKDVIPIDLPATPQNADKVRLRLDLIMKLHRAYMSPPRSIPN